MGFKEVNTEKQLRGWQAEALPAVLESIDDRPLVRAVMGAGKSVLIAELVKRIPDTLRVIISTSSVRLVDGLAETLEWWAGIAAGKFYTHAKESDARVIVACNDSLLQLAESLKGEPVEMWIADEAHKSECDSVKQAIRRLDPYRRVGFTATPWRDNDERLTLFDTLAYNYTAAQAIEDGVVVEPDVRHYRGEAETLDEACAEAISYAVGAGDLGPGLVNARDIADAESFSCYLRSDWGVTAPAIHSEMGREEQDSLIEKLHRGDVDALVHVNMLAEGVDMPWLRWLCCRRPVGSPVRFAQEVGRVLRTHPGKGRPPIFDPHNLFATFKLDAEAILSGGGVEEDDPIRLPALHLDFLCGQIRDSEQEPDTHRGVPITLIDPVESYVVKLHLQFEFAGIIEPEIKSLRWRSDRPSEGQIKFVANLENSVARVAGIPEEHRRGLSIACAAAPGLKKGAVSDLIDVLIAIRDSRGWPLGDESGEVAA